MSNTIGVPSILRTSALTYPYNRMDKFYIEKNAFSLMNNLKCLNLMIDDNSDDFIYVLENGSFNGLQNLDELRLGLCEFKEPDFQFNLPNLKKLKLLTYCDKIPAAIFNNLDKLVELEMGYYSIYNEEGGNDSSEAYSSDKLFSGLKNLQILRTQMRSIKENFFKDLTNLKELSISSLYNPTSLERCFDPNAVDNIEKNAFKGLDNLIKLDLSFNKLDILKSNVFAGLKNLKELILESSGFKDVGKDAFKGLFNLEFLNIRCTFVEALDKDVFKDLKNLKKINLDGFICQKFEGNPFRYLKNLKSITAYEDILKMLSIEILNNIEEVELTQDSLNEKLDPIRNIQLNNLTSLNSSISSKNSSLENDTFKGFEQIRKLKLKFGSIRYLSKYFFDDLTNLEHLDLSDNFNNFQHDLFIKLKNLTTLDLSQTESFEAYSSFSFNFKQMKHLDLSFISSIKLNRKIFKNLTNLETLNLRSINGCDKIPLNDQLFYGLINLKQLDLSYNSINHLNANVFKHLVNLIELDLSECELTSVDLNAFRGLSKLESLDLLQNRIEEMSEEHFKDLVNLKKLNLDQNPFIYRKDIAKFYSNLNLTDLNFHY